MNKLLVTSVLIVGLSFSLLAQEPAAPRPDSSPSVPPRTDTGWITYTSEDGSFSVLLPGKPETKAQTTKNEHGPYTTHACIAKDSTHVYIVGWVDYDPSFDFDRRAELEANRDNFVKGVNANLLSSEDITIDGYPVIEFVAQSADQIFSSRVYMVGRRPYQIFFASPKGEDDPRKKSRFFNSFKIINSPRPSNMIK